MSKTATLEMSTSTNEQLVRIVTLEGDEFDALSDFPEVELAAHLALWDYGDENDGAATILGYVTVPEAERFGAHTITSGDLEYWLSVDKGLRICSLLRRPLTDRYLKG